MKWKGFVQVFSLSAFLLAAGVVSAQDKPLPYTHVPQGLKAAKTPHQIMVEPTYSAILLSDAVVEPWGVAVTASGKQVYVNLAYSYQIMKYESGSLTLFSPWFNKPSACQFRENFGLFIGDSGGRITHLIPNTDTAVTLANLGYPDLDYPPITALCVDPVSSTVFFYDMQSLTLYKIPNFDGHTPIPVATLPFYAYGLAIKGTQIYISDAYGNRLYRMPKKGGPLTLVTAALLSPTGIAFDKNGNLYIAEYYNGSIARIKKGTTTVNRIATGFFTPGFIAVDGKNNIYFTDFIAGELWMLVRNPIVR